MTGQETSLPPRVTVTLTAQQARIVRSILWCYEPSDMDTKQEIRAIVASHKKLMKAMEQANVEF